MQRTVPKGARFEDAFDLDGQTEESVERHRVINDMQQYSANLHHRRQHSAAGQPCECLDAVLGGEGSSKKRAGLLRRVRAQIARNDLSWLA